MAGGSFSNWWCSVFNVDLALSVALTTISTACSVFMLPLNLFVYARLAYGHSVQVRAHLLAHPVVCSSTRNSTFALVGRASSSASSTLPP